MNLTKKIILGVLVYLTFMLVLLPADIAVKLAPLPTNMNISGVSGSIWSGKIESVSIGQRQIDQVQWQLSPWGLLLGKVTLDLVIGNPTSPVNGKGLVTLSMSGIDAEGLKFDAPSRFLLGETRLPFRTEIAGELSVFIGTLQQGLPWCEQLDGKLFLNAVRVKNQFGHYPLGDIELALACIDGNVEIRSNEEMNQLGFNGSVLLQAEKNVVISAKIKETASQPDDLKKALTFLGKKDSNGYYPIKYQGIIPL
ncbi:type II secretion system protein N [Shewanella sp. VB17]|uniref:type II secretion system protein N n=1 Tax=Shewanella sp. VB17 TaxID=2739432 RepID=UPI0015636CBD|nr:type II secretion system protein N [Shewanella sp. VB17]NRD71985.1 type II secretion system protein N [Shewanella sp. VB17]